MKVMGAQKTLCGPTSGCFWAPKREGIPMNPAVSRPIRAQCLVTIPARFSSNIQRLTLVATVLIASLPFHSGAQTAPSPRPGLPQTPDQRNAPGQSQPVRRQQARISDDTQTISIPNGTGVDLSGLGGQVYSTGLEDIWVTIIPKSRATNITYLCQIYILGPGTAKYVGSNYEKKSLNLGKFPAGELLIGTSNTAERITVQTGPASRNPDNLPHATVRELPDGVVDVRFEDSRGLPEQRLVNGSPFERKWAHDNFFQDTVLQFSGGVTADAAVMTLLPMLKDTDPEKRQTAAAVLKQAYPKIARAAGAR